MRSRSPWTTPSQYSELENLKALIRDALRPASKDDRAYWVGRFLQHFPGRNVSKDGVMISDIAMDLADMPHYAIVEAFGQLRREADRDNPFLPQSGEILKRVGEIAKALRERLDVLSSPPKTPQKALPAPEPQKVNCVPWAGMKYHEVLEKGLLGAIEQHCQCVLFGEKRREYGLYLKDLCAFPADVVARITHKSVEI